MSRKKRNESLDCDLEERKEFLKKGRDDGDRWDPEHRLRPDCELGSKVTIQSQEKMNPVTPRKEKNSYKYYALAIVSIGYVLGELGHFLVGSTSKEMAIDLHYGDIACQFDSETLSVIDIPVQCDSANSSEICESLELNGTRYCEWNYNGLGLDYQLLAGPSFMAVFTIGGVIFGVAADRFNRVRLLTFCIIGFGVAVFLTGMITEYWQLVLFRMLTAAGEAGCTPLSTGLLSDWFSDNRLGLAMAIYNWGIFAGYGSAFPIGRYVTQMNIWDKGWRICYYGSGLVAIVIAFIIGLTLREPERKIIGEEKQNIGKNEPLLKIFFQPRMIFLAIGASIRCAGGYCIAYNCDLFYRKYYPDYNLNWWLFFVTAIVGSLGVLIGGVVSDKFVAKRGVKSRVFILGISQILATPFSFGSIYFGPVLAMICLALSYFFAEMWVGVLFAILVEIVPLSVRSKTVGIFCFIMNNVGGNLPILVEPVAKSIGYRESLYIFFGGFFLVSSVLFFITVFIMDGPRNKTESPSDRNINNMVHISELSVTKLPEEIPSINNSHL